LNQKAAGKTPQGRIPCGKFPVHAARFAEGAARLRDFGRIPEDRCATLRQKYEEELKKLEEASV